MGNKSIYEKINSRKGQSIVEVLVFALLLTFILFFIPAIYRIVHVKGQMSDVLTASMQKIATEGGLTDNAADYIYSNLELKGFLPEGSTPAQRSSIVLYSDADARSGHTENLKYKDGVNKKILISIYIPADSDVSLLNGLSKILGAKTNELPFQNAGSTNYYYRERLYVDSEKSSY